MPLRRLPMFSVLQRVIAATRHDAFAAYAASAAATCAAIAAY